MLYDLAFWIALLLFGLGIVHRLDAWVLRPVGLGDRGAAPGARLAAAGRAVVGTLASSRLARVVKALVVDVLLQWRILRDTRDRLAWIMHACVFYGFVLLLVFHALGSTFAGLISDNPYYSTLNPFLRLRDLAGVVLGLGLVLAVVRRVRRRATLRTGPADVFVLLLLATIVGSGFLLHAAKITAVSVFDRMVAEYAGGLPEADVDALRAYWVRHYGLVAPVASHDPGVLAQGAEAHELACRMCHDAPTTAVVSYPLSRALAPVAPQLDAAGAVTVLWYLHVLACCVGLGYVAFGKMFHVIATPVSLVVAEAGATPSTGAPAAALTRQAVELDGCRHGGACHDGCPVFRRRQERIGERAPFSPVLAYLHRKSAAALGSRPVAG